MSRDIRQASVPGLSPIVLSVVTSWLLTQPLVAQPVINRVEIRREIESILPALGPEPVRPVAPRKPGMAPSAFFGLLAGGGAFVGSATLCGKATLVGTGPLGSKVNGQYVAPGQSIDVPANTACVAGVAAGTMVTSTFLLNAGRKSSYKRAVARYEAEALRYPTDRVAWERQVAERGRAVDSLVTVKVAELEETYRQNELRRLAAVSSVTPSGSPAGPPVSPSAPSAPLLIAPRTGLVNPTAVAVVIGNSKYQRPEVPGVNYAGRDADAMRRFLVETFGFKEDNIIFEENATYTTMQRIFGTRDDHRGQLFGYLRPGTPSDVFVFYSGHGAPDPGSGSAYLVPADADPQAIRLTGFPVRQLYFNLAQLPARSITVVLDACFSGLADRGSLLQGVSPLTLRVENPVLAAENAVVLTASQASEVSGWYDQQQHGLYTYVLLNTIAQRFQAGVPAALPTAREINAAVSEEVLRLSRRLRQRDQNPQVFGVASDAPLPFLRAP